MPGTHFSQGVFNHLAKARTRGSRRRRKCVHASSGFSSALGASRTRILQTLTTSYRVPRASLIGSSYRAISSRKFQHGNGGGRSREARWSGARASRRHIAGTIIYLRNVFIEYYAAQVGNLVHGYAINERRSERDTRERGRTSEGTARSERRRCEGVAGAERQ